jgi:hypothetical protein
MSIILMASLSAFDGERKGLVIGVGVGPGLISVEDDKNIGFMADVEIGYALNNQFQIQLVNKTAWYSAYWVVDYSWMYQWVKKAKYTTVQGLSGLGATYFFQPEAPSLYLIGGIGMAYTWAPGVDAESYTGIGLCFGGGYEFARYWRAESNVTWGKPTGGGTHFNVLTAKVTIGYIVY